MNIKKILLFLVAVFGVFAIVGVALWRFGSTSAVPDPTVVEGDSRHIRGSGEVTLVEFSDFQCPGCRAVQPVVEEILQRYEGRVRLVFRHYPLTNIHPNAMPAAWASEAADKQGKFWEYHDLLFARQNEWGESKDSEIFMGYAQELGLNQEQFRSDMESDETKQIVGRDASDAFRLRLPGTPSFFLNGEKVEVPALLSRLEDLMTQ